MATLTATGGTGNGAGSLGQTSPGNFTDVYGFDNAPSNTNLPAIYDREVTRYGDQGLATFLRYVGSEEGVNSQQIRWAEETRLHISYNRVRRTTLASEDFMIHTNDQSGVLGSGTLNTGHAIRVGDKVLIGDTDTTHSAIVSNVSGATITLRSPLAAASTADAGFAGLAFNTTNLNLFVFGNESEKGSDSPSGTIQAQFESFTNNMIILRKFYSINGSDTAQVGWVRGAGTDSYYWFLKGKHRERRRFEDYTETMMLEEQPVVAGSPAATSVSGELGSRAGSRGLFYEITNRGNTLTGGFSSGTASEGRTDFDTILTRLDAEGAIEENMFFLNRSQTLAIDDILAKQNGSVGGATSSTNTALTAQGTSYGAFNNSKDQMLNLGFNGYRRGSYDFYYKSWKYLNQTDGRAAFTDVRGVSIPLGTSQVYDDYKNPMSEPYISVKYLASEHDNRRMKSWVHGSVGGNYTSGLDAMQVEFLSERCLQLTAANNFFIFK